MMAAKAANLGPELMRFIEKSLLIQVMDAVWKEHLYALDHLRQGIGLRAYGQRDPLNEYKSEAFALFNAMLDELKERVTMMLARVELAPEPVQPPPPTIMQELHPQPAPAFGGDPEAAMEGAGCDDDHRAAAAARRGGGPERSRHLAQRVAQRAVPLRLRQEIQALPRPPELADDQPTVIARSVATRQSRARCARVAAPPPPTRPLLARIREVA